VEPGLHAQVALPLLAGDELRDGRLQGGQVDGDAIFGGGGRGGLFPAVRWP
jgi:hypothetical protein